MNYLKNNWRMDQDVLIEYILLVLSDGEFIYGFEELFLVMELLLLSLKYYLQFVLWIGFVYNNGFKDGDINYNIV